MDNSTLPPISSYPESVVLERARTIVKARHLRKNAARVFTTPDSVKKWLPLYVADIEHEVFSCIFLDSHNRVIEYQEMFRGTINGASVHPREVVKACMKTNAAALVVMHNHPSGFAEPSQADRALTRRLRDAMELVDVRLLDHFVIGGEEVVSFAERGWL